MINSIDFSLPPKPSVLRPLYIENHAAVHGYVSRNVDVRHSRQVTIFNFTTLATSRQHTFDDSGMSPPRREQRKMQDSKKTDRIAVKKTGPGESRPAQPPRSGRFKAVRFGLSLSRPALSIAPG